MTVDDSQQHIRVLRTDSTGVVIHSAAGEASTTAKTEEDVDAEGQDRDRMRERSLDLSPALAHGLHPCFLVPNSMILS
ncbi:hypothetical protein E1B28_007342 [Marasmius oreades]|uniref:Uncharacterized protein n=1 Tax=Marasmius oreades TaxID=181124 RepID=A0A9P7S1D8_9AGAR|nr:uncharacterized protein E1B28_007342 [Marasmius oreades]KAG7093684.1 hypothetical protein E1B28_007342 [Marasmius oreades]